MDNQVDKTKLQPGEALSIARILSGDYTEAIEALPELAPFLSSLGAPPPATREAPASAASQAKLRDEQARRKNNLATLPLQLAKQLEHIHERHEERFHGPQGESRSQSIADWTHPIPIEEIVCETDFSNIRLKPVDSEIDFLADSMSEEGLKVPITVSEGQDGKFLLRAGFRRVAAARKLAWTYIPAIVLPKDTPKISEHWTNIIENTARTSLRTYEIANAAHIMKKDFNVDPKTFARKAGYDPIYVTRMVKAVENLPPAILKHWKEIGNFPVDWYCIWSSMHHAEALTSFQLEVGQRFQRRSDPMLPADHPRQKKKRDRVMTATDAGLKRMQRLRFAVIAYTKPMDEATRQAYLEIIDYCMGLRDTVLDIYDCNARHQNARSKKQKEEVELSMEEEMQKMIAEVCTGKEDGKPIRSDVLPIRKPPAASRPRPAK